METRRCNPAYTSRLAVCALTVCSLRLSSPPSFLLSLLFCRCRLRISSPSLDLAFGRSSHSATQWTRTVRILSNLQRKKLICSCWGESGVKASRANFIQVQTKHSDYRNVMNVFIFHGKGVRLLLGVPDARGVLRVKCMPLHNAYVCAHDSLTWRSLDK